MIGKPDQLKKPVPTVEIAVQVVEGADIQVNESFYLPILSAFEKITEYMAAWNHQEEMEGGLFHIFILDFDQRAFREALVNAFCPRDYSSLKRVHIEANSEGVVIV